MASTVCAIIPPYSVRGRRMTDWHAEKHAACEALAKAVRTLAVEWPKGGLFRDKWMEEIWLPTLARALTDYERTKDAP